MINTNGKTGNEKEDNGNILNNNNNNNNNIINNNNNNIKVDSNVNNNNNNTININANNTSAVVQNDKQNEKQQQQQQQQHDASKKMKNDNDSGEETEGEDEIVEESPNGRWAKRRERVSQRDALAIDKAYLAMDTENGFEVVWNEIHIDRDNIDEESIQKLEQFFSNLQRLNHLNVVKFHGYWIDREAHKPRVIFITEYMASGSLKQFLRNAKKTNQPIKRSTWKRWCIQLLTALHYLHNFDTPIVHGELSCDTIYIQHNGLIKIGSISPDILHTYAKMQPDNNIVSKTAHFIAPEIRNVNNRKNETSTFGPEVDIYSFGIVALEMFNMELGGNGDTHTVTPELIEQSIEALEDSRQKDFVRLCLNSIPSKRSTSCQLLFHPLLYEVPTLKRFSAHYFYQYIDESQEFNLESLLNEIRRYHKTQQNLDDIDNDNNNNNSNTNGTNNTQINDDFIAIRGTYEHKCTKNKFIEDLSKYMEDVKAGLHPATVFLPLSKDKPTTTSGPLNPILNNLRGNLSGTQSPVASDSENSNCEKRKAQELSIKIVSEDTENECSEIYSLVITVSFEDKRKRGLKAKLENSDTAFSIADELIKYGLISEVDKDALIDVLKESLKIRDDKIEDQNKSKCTTPAEQQAIEC